MSDSGWDGFPIGGGVLVGMVHLPPLPGSPRGRGAAMDEIIGRAVREAMLLETGGFDAVLVENFGDTPFLGVEVGAVCVAAMSCVVRAVVKAVQIPVGVNMLRSDAAGALAVASVCKGQFIRVNVHTGVYATDQGIIEGRAAETLRLRAALGIDVRIFADVHVKHGRSLQDEPIELAAEEAAYRGLADGLIVTGPTTGRAADLDEVRRVKSAVPDRPVWIGSGVTAESAQACLKVADGVIVGTSLKRDGRTESPLDENRVREFCQRAKGRACR